MFRAVIATLKKMTSRYQKKTLAEKLAKAGRIEETLSENTTVVAKDLPDIEDALSAIHPKTKSKYFSPIQTRHQRKVASNEANPSKNLVRNENEKKLRHIAVGLKSKVLPALDKTKDQKRGAVSKTIVASKKGHISWEPPHWQQVLQNIRKMRAAEVAPVDSMGCQKCADDNADDKTQRYQKLVALMLSSQTKDETTFEAMQRLKQHTLTPTSIADMQANQLEDILHPVSFYKNKAKYLQQTARILIEKYAHDIPNNIKDLIALPGVGPKMAHICMAIAWNEVTGIGVDVHVHRIVNRLRWVHPETKDPERTRAALEQWLPKDLWREVNHLLVGFGQTTCTPLRPKCQKCLNRNICPAVNKSITAVDAENSPEDCVKLNKIIKMGLKKTKMQI